jgi:HK97 family phage prohead protease
MTGEIQRTAGRVSPILQDLPDRSIRYIFSDASVGRDMHTIAPDAWRTSNFLNNPVFLWAHQSDEPPIGRVEELGDEAGRLVGLVRYAERDAYPFADTIYELTKRGFLNATSTGWIPLEWTAANDRSRPGGLDFRKVELLEISQVPVPALPTALATARSAGIDTAPLFDWAARMLDSGAFAVLPKAELEQLRKDARMPSLRRGSSQDGRPAGGLLRAAGDWKCGAARDLAINHTAKWDGPEASGRMLDAATEGGKLNVAKARRGFLLYDAGNAGERGSYKEPFADLIDSKLTAVASGIRAAASRLPQVDGASDEAKASARKVIDHYEGQMTKEGGHAASEDDGARRIRPPGACRSAARPDERRRALFPHGQPRALLRPLHARGRDRGRRLGNPWPHALMA